MNNFLKGMGSVLVLFPNEKEKPSVVLPSYSSEDAMKYDWENVGQDLMTAASTTFKHCERID